MADFMPGLNFGRYPQRDGIRHGADSGGMMRWTRFSAN